MGDALKWDQVSLEKGKGIAAVEEVPIQRAQYADKDYELQMTLASMQ